MRLEELLSGNARAVASRRAAAAPGPRDLSVAVLTCADERIVPERIFDLPGGKLYTVRVAGNVHTPEIAGSLEVAVLRHGCPLILVLGHSGCSAVRLAHARDRVEGAVYDITRRIRHALEARSPEVTLAEAVEANVVYTVRELRERSRKLREREETGALRIAGAVYDLDSGAVRPVM